MSHKLVVVKWTDAQADLGWKDPTEEKTPNLPVFSVGWLTEDEEGYIVLAGDIGQDASDNRRIEIPRGMLLGMSELTTKRGIRVGKVKKKPKKVKKGAAKPVKK